jgi:hypothetical protein
MELWPMLQLSPREKIWSTDIPIRDGLYGLRSRERLESASIANAALLTTLLNAGSTNFVNYSMTSGQEPSEILLGAGAILSGSINLSELGAAIVGVSGTGAVVNAVLLAGANNAVVGRPASYAQGDVNSYVIRKTTLVMQDASVSVESTKSALPSANTELLNLIASWEAEDADKVDPQFNEDYAEFDANRLKFPSLR